MSRTLVISGLGAVCPGASGHAGLWELFRRETRPSLPERIPDEAFEAQPARLRHMDRLGRLALAATTLAIEDSRLAAASAEPSQTGVVFGSGYGCLPTNEEYLEGILERGARYGNPVVFQNTVTNAATGYISMVHDLRGPSATLCSGWTAGLEALRFGCQQIEDGHAERMVVGSADTLSPKLVEGLSLQGWLGPRGASSAETGALRVSEAGCALVLEDGTRARERGARLHAEVAGTGHRGGPLEAQARTLARAVQDALRAARLEPERLGAVFSCANGKRDFDARESVGLSEALGAHASRVPMLRSKAVLGETFSAAGPLSLLLAARSLETGRLPDASDGTTAIAPEWALVTALGEEGGAVAVVLRRAGP